MTKQGRGQAVTGEVGDATQGVILSTDVTHMHLLRHGEVRQLTERVVRGQLDVDLSDEGTRQHERLAAWMADAEPAPDHLFSSDLRRCRLLAEAVAARTGAEIELDKRLREQSMGSWEGKTWETLTETDGDAVVRYWDDYHRARPTGGESMEDLAVRVAGWWKETAPRVQGKRVVVVTHIGVIRVVVCQFLGIPVADALRFAPATASHTSLLLAEAGAVLSTFGERPWLTAETTP